MFTPTVIEMLRPLEPVTADTFIADLDHRSSDMRPVLAGVVLTPLRPLETIR